MFGFNRKSSEKPTIAIDIANATVIRVLLLIVAFVLGLAAVQQASTALSLIFMAFFLSLALNAPVHWLSQRLPGKRKGNRAAATAISFLIIVGLLVGFLASIVPPLVKQTSNFVSAAPQLIKDVRDSDKPIGKLIDRYDLHDEVDDAASELSSRLKEAGGSAVSFISKVGSSLISILTVLVLTFMMLVEGPRWIRLAKDILPNRHHARAKRLSMGMYRVVKGYVNGQVILAALAAAFLLPAMLILDIGYPVALMVIVFVCGLIPMVGHTIGAIIVSLVALFTSPVAAIIILGYYILYQQIENYVVQPRVQANTTNMSPLMVFMSVVIGVSFGGILGGLVAIPVAGCIRIALLDYLHAKKILDSEHSTAPNLTKA